MSKTVLMTPDAKRVVVDPKIDQEIYRAPRNPPDTGTQYLSGTDIHAHKARSGKIYFYAYNWSMWQGTETSIELLTRNEVEDFLIAKAGLAGWGRIDESEAKRLEEEFGFEIYTETG